MGHSAAGTAGEWGMAWHGTPGPRGLGMARWFSSGMGPWRGLRGSVCVCVAGGGGGLEIG